MSHEVRFHLPQVPQAGLPALYRHIPRYNRIVIALMLGMVDWFLVHCRTAINVMT